MSLVPPPLRAPPRRPAVTIAPSAPACSSNQFRSTRSDLQASLGDAAGYSVMVGLGETYFAAFALALGTGETIAGLIATLPMLCGATLQLMTPWAVAQMGSYRRWAILGVVLQAASLLLMPIAACFAASSAGWWVFLSATLYWGAGLSTAPAWNTWIEEIIPRRIRASYFACRARISQCCTLLGFAAGGIALQMGKASGGVLIMFGGIFLTAAACRYFSAWCLSRQSESPNSTGAKVRATYIPLRRVLADGKNNGGKLIWYLLAMQTAVQISGPYFTPYLLSERRMSYLSYMVLIGIAYVGKTVALPLWGRVAHTAGARRLLWIGGTAIIPISGLWLFSDPFEHWRIALPLGLSCSGGFLYLACVQVLSGIAWAAYELAMLLMFFEAIPRSHRTSMLTLYNFGNSAAMVAGGLIGATILQLLNESHAAYLTLFGVSSIARLCTVPVLAFAPPTPQKVVETADSLTGIHVRTPISAPSIRIDVAAATPAPEPRPIRRSA